MERVWLTESSRRVAFLPADGFAQQLGGVGQLELFLDVGAVGLDGLHAHRHHLGDLARFAALAQKLKHFQLAVGELVHQRPAGEQLAVHELFREGRRQAVAM